MAEERKVGRASLLRLRHDRAGSAQSQERTFAVGLLGIVIRSRTNG